MFRAERTLLSAIVMHELLSYLKKVVRWTAERNISAVISLFTCVKTSNSPLIAFIAGFQCHTIQNTSKSKSKPQIKSRVPEKKEDKYVKPFAKI